ncbi:hypothetical protein Tco_1255409 [Tanacetum coccineum]
MVEDNVGNQFRPNAVQNVRNQVVLNAVQNPGVQNVGNQNGLSVDLGIANQYKIGNVVIAEAEGAYDEIEEVNANCTLKDNLHQALTSGTQTNNAPVYDSDGSAEVHPFENCYNNDIFNMFTQEGQYTELLEPIPEPHQVQQNNSNVISVVSSVEQSGGTVEQHPATAEETRVKGATAASGLKPRSNTKKDRTLPAKTDMKKVEDHPKNNKSSVKRQNRVDSSISYKHTVINLNSNSFCKTCNKCLMSFNHDKCVVKSLTFVKKPPVKKVWRVKQVKQVWQATGKLFTNVEFQWQPTRRKFTLGEQCLLTRGSLTAQEFQKKVHRDSQIREWPNWCSHGLLRLRDW